MAARAIISKTWLISLHAKDTSIDIILAENKAHVIKILEDFYKI